MRLRPKEAAAAYVPRNQTGRKNSTRAIPSFRMSPLVSRLSMRSATSEELVYTDAYSWLKKSSVSTPLPAAVRFRPTRYRKLADCMRKDQKNKPTPKVRNLRPDAAEA